MTPGERRFAQRLIDKLEYDYLCWYDVPVGSGSVHPDFVVLHPRRGLLILEVKDWSLAAIKAADRTSFTLDFGKGLKAKPNPLEQARQYALAIADVMQKDPALVVAEKGRHEGQLCFPYGYGVVLTNIKRQAFLSSGLNEVIPSHRVICQDEMLDSVDADDLQKRLWDLFPISFRTLLTMPQIDRIRWHLYPEIRIESRQLALLDEPTATDGDVLPDLMRVMDLQQEQLARGLGEGHRVIHGVAGSGKTMILGFRCEQLASASVKPILVLCYNVALAFKLSHTFGVKGLTAKVDVRNFHAWCRDQLIQYHVALPPDGAGFFDALVANLIGAVERGQIPRAQYGAVLIDEGHDFKPEWLKLVTQMVDPNTNSLLLLYDDAQSIYERKRRNFSFSSVGIQAQGRTTVLRLNYRNTAEVLGVAYHFAKEYIPPEDGEVPVLAPNSAGRRGDLPVLTNHASVHEELAWIARQLRALTTTGRQWNEMAIVCRYRSTGEQAVKHLRSAEIPVEWLGDANGRKHFRPGENSVKVITMHSSKGLEFPIVAIPALGDMPRNDNDATEEAKLLYVAMTRAMERLFMTYHTESNFVKKIRQATLASAAR
jgi:hypothetical protein